MKNTVGNLTSFLVAALLLSFGLIYLFKSSFMPYHAVAVALEWKQVNPSMQHLLLALMRAVAGGFIAVSFVIVFLQYQFSIHKFSWIPTMIFITATLSLTCTAYATIIVITNSEGRPPLSILAFGELGLILGFISNRKQLKNNPV